MYRDIWIKFMLNLVELHKLKYALVLISKTDKYTTEIYMSYTYP